MISVSPLSREAYNLLHEGALALAEIERTGMKVDVDYCRIQQKIISRHIDKLKRKLLESREGQIWRKKYGNKLNINSGEQLRYILFDELKIESLKSTQGGKQSVDDSILQFLKIPFTDQILRIRKLSKLRDTFLDGLIRHISNDGLLHPFFNLHIVRTYRSSSDSPNFQNIPTRDSEMKKVIRRAFLPRKGRRFGGVDYSGAEVRTATIYHQDSNMVKYIGDKTTDMHRDMAMDCYLLRREEVTDDIRFCAKGMFVFAEFYGDYYKNCANSLWNAIDSMNLVTKDGIPLREHLRDCGIKNYQKFEDHIRDVEDRFWNERFPDYAKWKERWYKDYLKRGYFDMLTGFRCSGIMSKNDVINYPVQGVAFHFLLWSLIQVVKWLKEQKLETLVVGQIHDEMTLDAVDSELITVLKKVKQIMCDDIRDYWNWINVPFDIDAKFAGVDESWYYKTKVEF